ncbi:MAG: hypothetical protein A3B66_08725 [Alphaproteobacteria bacterium RIFCSPHIGHO2_02_FULL_46_13]|nr:MAG: hypothetical protein A3B66_08725 [Alphaproteobacteria bacterium RIFCSPHIGHO2_02_FULL_46_13]
MDKFASEGYFVLKGKIYKLAAIDMDGTLIDNEPLNRQAVQKAAGPNCLIDWSNCAGKKEFIIHGMLKEKYGADKITSTADEFVAACKRGYAENADKIEARLAMQHLLETFELFKVPTMVVTNTETDMAIEKLKHCELFDHVGDVVGSDLITGLGLKSKPSGDGYRLAADTHSVSMKDVLVIEDSSVGVDAGVDAKAGGIVQIIDCGTEPHPNATITVSGHGSSEILALSNQIRRETIQHQQKKLASTPEPSSPAYA